MPDIKTLLNVCGDPALRQWAANKLWPEIYNTCHQGDWLLLLFQKANPQDTRLLTLAKGHCANTVRHLMKDARSVAAVDTAIAYGNNEITEEELSAVAASTGAAAAGAYAAANYGNYAPDNARIFTHYHAANAADLAAYLATSVAVATAYITHNPANVAADAACAIAYSYHHMHYPGRYHPTYDTEAIAAGAANLLLTANIVRQHIPINKWNII